MNFQTVLATTPTLVLVMGGVLVTLILAFVAFFLIPGIRHIFRLWKIQRGVVNFQPKNIASQFKRLFSEDERLSHLWKEYQDSLHIQQEDRDGQVVTIAVRATVPSELYFNTQAVVDSRLHTEFFKHLPGIFTGIGIIGTFIGLISGLRAFQVSDNAATVRASLESLMHSVSEAFLISASAIFAAMVVTLLEKLVLAALYRRTEDISHAIDARFESGAGEEYLSRLVRSSEDSASQSKILKDALVNELGDLLRELTAAQIGSARESQAILSEQLVKTSEAQIEASRLASMDLGEAIASGIKDSMQGPLQLMADTVKSASGDQSASAIRMLQDVMASFSQRLNDLFGGQISGLSDLNQQTARSIQDAVGTLQQLVANMEESSRRSTDSMAERMAEAIEKMESRQEAINEQTTSFVEQIRQLVASSQWHSPKSLDISHSAV